MTNDSFLSRMVTNIHLYLDEPTLNAKYTEAILVPMVEQSYAHVIAEINRNRTQPVVAKYTVTYAQGTEKYLIPQLIGATYAIYSKSSTGTKVFYNSRSRYNPLGRFIWIEGACLNVQYNGLSTGNEIIIEYLPSGTARLHNGTCTIDSTGLLVTYGATPTDGVLDTHANAYAGCIFRLLSSSDSSFNFIQERTIVSNVNTTRVATLDLALDPNPESTGTTTYEIAPALFYGLDHIVALYLAYWIGSIEFGPVRARGLRNMYRDSIRSARLDAFYSNLQDMDKSSFDSFQNRRYLRC